MKQRTPRLLDAAFLAWLRRQPCACGCRRSPCDAAHLRAGSIAYGKEYPGFQRKPDDRWALPLFRPCHASQHAFGDEIGWWQHHGVLDPFALCLAYYKRFGGTGGKAAPSKSGRVTRKPPGKRAKIQSRPFSKQHRPLRRPPR